MELIARYLLARIGGRAGRAVQLSPDTLAALERYDWPGNVRELENALEYAVALGRGQTVQLEDLPAEIRSPESRPAGTIAANLPRAGAASRRPLRGLAATGGSGGNADPGRPGTEPLEPLEVGGRAGDEPDEALAADAGASDRLPLTVGSALRLTHPTDPCRIPRCSFPEAVF